MADNLAKTASKKASHLPSRTDISLYRVKEINRQITLDKWGRRWKNTNFHKYKKSDHRYSEGVINYFDL